MCNINFIDPTHPSDCHIRSIIPLVRGGLYIPRYKVLQHTQSLTQCTRYTSTTMQYRTLIIYKRSALLHGHCNKLIMHCSACNDVILLGLLINLAPIFRQLGSGYAHFFCCYNYGMSYWAQIKYTTV